MKRFKGIIALDIDGTLTNARHKLELSVQNYINRLIKEGWCLIFMTGRTFSFAYPLLAGFRGNYFFAPQNGSALYNMPKEECLMKRYLPASILEKAIPYFQDLGIGLLVEAGREYGDVCYYKPDEFTSNELEYLDLRSQISLGRWEPLQSFSDLPLSEFAVMKYFATESQAVTLAQKLSQSSLKVTVIRDPFRSGFYMALVNALGASKGDVLATFIALHPKGLPVIAAGDDYNDVEMLKNSRVKIIMQSAPAEMHGLADILAPPAESQGIIQGLEQGIWKALSK